METLKLIMSLYDNDPKIRNQSALIVGMVNETAALGALEQRYREETDTDVKQSLQWAGRRVEQANKARYTTIDAIFEHFQINRELTSGIDPDEADALRHSNSTTESGFSHIKMGSMLGADQLQTGHLDGERRQNKQTFLRLRPIVTSEIDISVKIKRLMDMSDPKRQKNAALELKDINNPAALPHLSWIVCHHENKEVCALAEKAGKHIYWNVNYAIMEHNGRLKLEMDKRRAHQIMSQPMSAMAVTPASNPDDLASILNQAQKNRKHRKH